MICSYIILGNLRFVVGSDYKSAALPTELSQHNYKLPHKVGCNIAKLPTL